VTPQPSKASAGRWERVEAPEDVSGLARCQYDPLNPPLCSVCGKAEHTADTLFECLAQLRASKEE
jgi:hypothetical protein